MEHEHLSKSSTGTEQLAVMQRIADKASKPRT
jgi:hypothetical protein